MATLAGAAAIGVNAAPAVAADGFEPVPADEASLDALVGQVEGSIGDVESVPEGPARGGTPASGAATDAPAGTPSAGSGGADAVGQAVENVVSGAVERDIAPVVAELAETTGAPGAPSSDAAGGAPSDAQAGAPSAGESPSQSAIEAVDDVVESVLDTAQGDAGASPARESGTGRAVAPDPPPRYQDDSAQYQSAGISDSNSWNWTWYLELDCEGIVSSISDQNGGSESESWLWTWNWNWTCGLDGGSEAAADALVDGSAVAVDTTGGSAPSGDVDSQRAAGTAGGVEPSWLWTWTFTFCGRTATIVTPLAVDPALRWIWDWTWNWACTAAEGASGAGEAGSARSAEPLAPELAPELARGLPQESAEISDTSTLFPLPLSPFPLSAGRAPGSDELLSFDDELVRFDAVDVEALDALVAGGPAPSFLFPPAAASPPQAPRPDLRGGAPAQQTADSRPPLATLAPSATSFETSEASPPVRATAEPEPRARRGDASPRRQRSPGPPRDTSPRGIPGAPASSGGAPGGGTSGGGGGIAALTGLFVLAAPGLGRRIREARELSPRAPVRDRLERPG